MKTIIRILLRYRKALVFLILALVALYLISVVFLFASFKVTSESMYPELRKNDQLIVFKPTIGARLFNIVSAIRGEEFNVYRMPGFRDVKRNDILVFNYPYKEWDTWDHIVLNLKDYYVKRCIGLPGDSVLAKNGIFEVLGVNYTLGNYSMQHNVSADRYDSITRPVYIEECKWGWDLLNWGPVYIPKKGESILINKDNYNLYKKIIEWESSLSIDTISHSAMSQDGIQYRFKHDYYFVAGDNTQNSIDSRYWGLVPDDFIVGKVAFAIEEYENFIQMLSKVRSVV